MLIRLKTYKTNTRAKNLNKKLPYIMILIFKNNNTVVCATDKSGENKNRNTVQQMKDETLDVHRVYNTL